MAKPSEAIVEAVAEIAADAETAESRVELAETLAENAIDNANEQIEAAQELAEGIALAAIQTELGRRIDALETERYTWREQLESLRAVVEQIQSELANLSSSILLQSQPALPEPTEPPQTVITETADQVLETVLNPASVGEPTPSEPAEPAPAQRRRVFR